MVRVHAAAVVAADGVGPVATDRLALRDVLVLRRGVVLGGLHRAAGAGEVRIALMDVA